MGNGKTGQSIREKQHAVGHGNSLQTDPCQVFSDFW